MKIKPTSKTGGVLLELGARETQVPAQAAIAPPLFNLKRILVPVDFSDCSKYALQYANALAKQSGAELQLLHIVEPYPAVPEMYPVDVETLQDARSGLDTLHKELADVVPVKTVLRTGTPYLEIAQAAQDLKSDLIIISTHGRKGITRMFLGSTTERVVRHAPCPVLVVRETKPFGEAAQCLARCET